jgi:hypothetical protein
VLHAVQLAVQRVLFFTRQTAAMLGSHVTRFLTHQIQPMMERVALWRRVEALAYSLIDVMPQRVDTATDLVHPMDGFHMWIRARGRFLDDIDLAGRDDASCEGSCQRRAKQRANNDGFEGLLHGSFSLMDFETT